MSPEGEKAIRDILAFFDRQDEREATQNAARGACKMTSPYRHPQNLVSRRTKRDRGAHIRGTRTLATLVLLGIVVAAMLAGSFALGMHYRPARHDWTLTVDFKPGEAGMAIGADGDCHLTVPAEERFAEKWQRILDGGWKCYEQTETLRGE